MIEQPQLKHHIQKTIMEVLLRQKSARFSELRPPRVDTNLFSYHLKNLISSGFIVKNDRLYTLGPKGLVYVDMLSTKTGQIRRQPKIISMLVVQNPDGLVLLQKRTKQPYIDAWTLPYGKVHFDDVSIEMGADREVKDKLGLSNQAPVHVGDCYIRVRNQEGDLVSASLAHIFRFETDEVKDADNLKWVEPLDLRSYPLAPAVEEIITRSFFGDEHFFEQFEARWSS